MSLTELSSLFFTEIQATPPLEWAGVAFGLAEVLLARANKIALYPCGIISVIISSIIFFESKLYAESLLNIYYLVMSIYGWWLWVKPRNSPALPIDNWNKKDKLVSVGIVFGGFALLYFLLSHFTDSNVPVWDAFVSATAWAGMWLLARRKIQNWVLLNISNALAIPLLFHKNLPLYGLLTIFLFVIAIFGYLDWKKKMVVTQNNIH